MPGYGRHRYRHCLIAYPPAQAPGSTCGRTTRRGTSAISLLGKDAAFHTYDELLAGADPGIAKELLPEVWERKYHRAQVAIESLSAALAGASVDLALVIGDDQRELFVDDGIPAFACFTGTELVDMAPDAETFAKIPRASRPPTGRCTATSRPPTRSRRS